MRSAFFIAGSALLISTTLASAQSAPRPKPIPKNASEVVLTNARTVAVTGVAIADGKGKRMGSLKKPLDAGKKLTIKLPAKAGCLFTINAAFADNADFEQTEVDLCVDKQVRFTD